MTTDTANTEPTDTEGDQEDIEQQQNCVMNTSDLVERRVREAAHALTMATACCRHLLLDHVEVMDNRTLMGVCTSFGHLTSILGSLNVMVQVMDTNSHGDVSDERMAEADKEWSEIVRQARREAQASSGDEDFMREIIAEADAEAVLIRDGKVFMTGDATDLLDALRSYVEKASSSEPHGN